MTDETIRLLSSDIENLNEVADEYSITSQSSSQTTSNCVKMLYVLGVIIACPIAYYLLFYLPNAIPPPTKSELDIRKVLPIPVYLQPISLKNSIDSDQTFDIENYQFKGRDLDTPTTTEAGTPVRRLILIGDIHGSYRQLAKLMKKLQIDHEKDYVMMLGDFISKGPDNEAVLNWAIANNVGCVLGNHETYILNRYAQFHSLRRPDFVNDDKERFTDKEFYDLDDEMKIAKKLTPVQADYLLQCPLISLLGPVDHSSEKKGQTKKAPLQGVAVHGGLQWHIKDLEEQDPETVLTIRSLLPPDYTVASDETPEGSQPWVDLWHKYQNSKDKHLLQQKVFYGHNARRGLNLQKFSVGLDTACVSGGQLSALAVWAEEEKGSTVYREKLYQVSC